MPGFTLVWVGQLVSMLGSGMTGFAITIWAWQETGQATVLALVGLSTFGPTVLLGPMAGAIVDRFDRKRVMLVGDLASSVPAAIMLGLYSVGALEVWHLYVLGAWAGSFNALHFPAYSAAISTMVAKAQFARANGMLALAESSAGIAAPVLAGLLIATLGIAVVFVIDIVTFIFAALTLLAVRIPSPPREEEGRRPNLWRESLFGFRYIVARRPLLHLQLVFTSINFSATLGAVMIAPMVLARSGNDELSLATVQAALGVGGVVGGALLSLWGGPRRRVLAVLFGMMGSALFGTTLLGLGQSLTVWVVAAFLSSVFIPLLNGSNQAIWQSKIAPALQGRVFAARATIARVMAPLAMALAGPLADRVLEPAMQPGGALVGVFGPLLGSGPGAGMGLMLVMAGLASFGVAVLGLSVRSVRHVEDLIPDHDADPPPAPQIVPA
jgi:MFS transporter, DHA3 family, macrolide efflux protein